MEKLGDKVIIDSIWYNHQLETIGIVKVRGNDGEIRYYIGVGFGHDKKDDEHLIAFWGAKFDPLAGVILIPAL